MLDLWVYLIGSTVLPNHHIDLISGLKIDLDLHCGLVQVHDLYAKVEWLISFDATY